MSFTNYAKFHAAPLVLRSGERRDEFHYFTITLCLGLALFWLCFGAPKLAAGEPDGAFVAVSGP